MPEPYKLYLDQMFSLDVALSLRKEGYDVVRPSETGLARADDHQILQKAISDNRILITLDNYYTLWSLPQVQISVIPACPESFRKDSRRASLAGMTQKINIQIMDALRSLPQGSSR